MIPFVIMIKYSSYAPSVGARWLALHLCVEVNRVRVCMSVGIQVERIVDELMFLLVATWPHRSLPYLP